MSLKFIDIQKLSRYSRVQTQAEGTRVDSDSEKDMITWRGRRGLRNLPVDRETGLTVIACGVGE